MMNMSNDSSHIIYFDNISRISEQKYFKIKKYKLNFALILFISNNLSFWQLESYFIFLFHKVCLIWYLLSLKIESFAIFLFFCLKF